MPAATRAVLIDALGTLVELEPPAPRLHAALGGDLDLGQVERAMWAEMAYYRQHSHEGRDPGALAELRERCAALLSRELGRDVGVETMMSAIRFRAFDDAAPTLRELRERGLGLVCVSNWDCSLPRVLDGVGLATMLDVVVTSAETGHAKPDRRIFEAGLRLAGCAPGEALVVGDTEDEDIAGAREAGIPALLVLRAERGQFSRSSVAPGMRVISSLGEISHHLAP